MKREDLYKALDSYFDAAWADFSDEVRKRITASNKRMYKILYKLKGEDFVVNLKKYIKKHGGFIYISFSKTSQGLKVIDKDFGEIFVHTNDGNNYKLFIPIRDRFIYLNVSNEKS